MTENFSTVILAFPKVTEVDKREPREYIFPLPRNAFPREGTGVKTDFFFREKVSLSAVVGKKDGCLTDRR